MRDSECEQLLAWALPQLGLRWAGFRRVKRQVCRRVRARIRQLGLADARAYAACLASDPREWSLLEAMCGITISRFYRDREVFDRLTQDVLPGLARQLPPGEPLRVWSAGCASGEEPYSIALIWELQVAASFPGRELRVLATDRDAHLLARAASACYRPSSLRELPQSWIARSFSQRADTFCLDPALRRSVTFQCQDLRRQLPTECFELILCRNLAFSYFEPEVQRELLRDLLDHLSPNGYLVVGLREQLPAETLGLRRATGSEYIYQRG